MNMGHGHTNILVIAKEPLPGKVKTRLTPPYTPAEAAGLALAALRDTLDVVSAAPARRKVLVLAGRAGDWLPAGIDVIPQCGGGLDERLADAFAAMTGPTLLIGMDTPQLTAAVLEPVLTEGGWRGCDAWFGPAADGGFWALGLAEPDPSLLRGVPMSRADTGARQRDRLIAAGLAVQDLPVLRDVDTAADVAQVSRLMPSGRFAAEARRLAEVAR
jgi:glycosyltransferase A (GT-A) superfamily protein (DUF2064 family)